MTEHETEEENRLKSCNRTLNLQASSFLAFLLRSCVRSIGFIPFVSFPCFTHFFTHMVQFTLLMK